MARPALSVGSLGAVGVRRFLSGGGNDPARSSRLRATNPVRGDVFASEANLFPGTTGRGGRLRRIFAGVWSLRSVRRTRVQKRRGHQRLLPVRSAANSGTIAFFLTNKCFYVVIVERGSPEPRSSEATVAVARLGIQAAPSVNVTYISGGKLRPAQVLLWVTLIQIQDLFSCGSTTFSFQSLHGSDACKCVSAW